MIYVLSLWQSTQFANLSDTKNPNRMLITQFALKVIKRRERKKKPSEITLEESRTTEETQSESTRLSDFLIIA